MDNKKIIQSLVNINLEITKLLGLLVSASSQSASSNPVITPQHVIQAEKALLQTKLLPKKT